MSSNRRGAETRIAKISTHVAPAPGYKYDVFLSFRGPDSRYTVADVIYEGLVGAGISVFRDNEELPVGENIGLKLERAIDDSRIYVPIFSEGYASSAWCLQELTRMVKRQRESAGHEIVPVFYGASPSDVRHKKGPYGEGLLKHKGRYGEERVREWREALAEVADLKGWDARNARLGKLVNDLVQELSIKLKKRQKVLPDHLVGINDRVKEVVQWLDCRSLDVRYLVVHGMGGIGKTTLVKAVFNEIAHLYDGCSFLLNIRERSQINGVVTLQKQLLSDVLRRTTDVHDFNDGINMIQSRFRDKKVLIVFDDVDDVDQLMALTKVHNWLSTGSRIIITTRDVGLLPAEAMGRQDNVPFEYFAYEMTELNPCHTLQLFSKHAFRETLPPDDRETLSSEIVATTGGNPLALELLGSYLRGRRVEIWVETLEFLKRSPHEKVHETLRITYDRLSFEQQQIYLDIACFFNGHERRLPEYMWKDCGFFPKKGLAALTDMSLLKINCDRFLMHEQLLALGREIVRKENHLNAGNRSRLWESEECLRILCEPVHHQQTRNVELLRLRLPRVQTLTSQEFAALPKLRFLDVEGAKFTGDYKNVFGELRWLSWDRCPTDFDATNFSPTNLVVLELSNSELRDDWLGWHQIMKSSKLKVVELRECSRLTGLPDLSALSTLERLTIRNCQSLIEIGESIGKLVRLNYLEIDACSYLRELPEAVGCLKALKELIVRGTTHGPVGSYLPQSIGNLQSLTRLEMESVGISELPHSIGELKDLEFLCLSRCDELRKLPDSIGGLVSLLELDISCTKVTELPDSIGNLRKLKIIRMNNSDIRRIPRTIGMLEKLEELYAEKCKDLKGDISVDITGLSSLRILDLSHTHLQCLPRTIKKLSHLQILCLRDCHQLQELPELPASLQELRLSSISLREIPDLSNLTNLIELNLASYPEEFPRDAISIHTPELKWIGRLNKLRSLTLVHKNIVAPPTELGSLPGLERLDLSCFDLRSLTQMLPPTLSMLKLINLNSLGELSPRSDFKYLSSLELCKSWLIEIPLSRFGQLENLMELTVSNCTRLVRLSCLSSLKKLRVLYLLNCPRLVEIQGLVELESLQSIRIGQCSSLVKLPNLLKLKKLRTMEFWSCKSLVSFPYLSPAAYEHCHLVVAGCDKLANHTGPCRLHKYKRQCRNPRSRL